MDNSNTIRDFKLRHTRMQTLMEEKGIDLCLFTANANLFYLSGCVFDGYIAVPAQGSAMAFIRRPLSFPLSADILPAFPIRKPEDIPSLLLEEGIPAPARFALEDDDIHVTEWHRLRNLFKKGEPVLGTQIARQARMIKTNYEIEQINISARRQAAFYRKIPSLYAPGMTDQELAARIEYAARSDGHLGIFRTFGFRMEVHMGTVLAGDNGAEPSCYDFSLGGTGLHPSMPLGPSGEALRDSSSIMVDIIGNYTGYQSDCSRTFSVGRLPQRAYTAHDLSIEIQRECAKIAEIGRPCCDLYNLAMKMASENGFEDCFMGTQQQAKFIGHGLGIEINELPVLSVRCETPLAEGMVIAIEPKFIIPAVGPVGTENTYVMTDGGLVCITLADETIIRLA